MPSLPGLTRPWEIYLVHHTHVDIGYTEPQQTIMRKHPEFIARALDFCTATDSLPPGERFTWACEVSWTVKAFLDRYPERAEEFFRRVREGRIEVTGLYLTLTDLYSEELLARTLDYAPALAGEHGFEVVTAMNDDNTGWAWGLPRMMSARGVLYFDTAINEVRGGGVRPLPSPFYWASPDGSRVLMWHGGSYLNGNLLGLNQPGVDERVTDWLARLESEGYPHSAVETRIHGEFHDNAPPGLWICDAVKEWNARWDYPKLHLCTPRTWFEHIEAQWPEPIKELRLAWPDWFSDGNVSALYEAALVRSAQADIVTAKAAAAAGGALDREGLQIAEEAAMFFCEHTWGAWCSTDDPFGFETRAQWNRKAEFAYTAAIEASALKTDAVYSLIKENGGNPEIAVFNPLTHERTDLVEVVVPNYALGEDPHAQVLEKEISEEGPVVHLVDSDTGQPVAVSRIPTLVDSSRRAGQTLRFVAMDVPPSGWRRYRIEPGGFDAVPGTQASGETILENSYFRLEVDPIRGGIRSLIDLSAGRELVASGEYSLNQYVHELIDSPEGREALSKWGKAQYDTPFRRRTPSVSICSGPSMPFGRGLVLESGGGDLPLLRSEIVLRDDLPRVDILNTVTKLPIDRAESIYVAFPLASSAPVVYLDLPGAVMRPGLDQVPGTATDWHGIQHYFAVESPEWTTVVVSPDVPLVQVNGINTGKWQKTLPPHNGLVMSWAMNNYWFTNFPATEGGRIDFRYSVSGYPGPFDRDKSSQLAHAVRQPLCGLFVPRSTASGVMFHEQGSR